MNDLIMNFVLIFVAVFVWFKITKFFIAQGRGLCISILAGVSTGFCAGVVTLVIGLELFGIPQTPEGDIPKTPTEQPTLQPLPDGLTPSGPAHQIAIPPNLGYTPGAFRTAYNAKRHELGPNNFVEPMQETLKISEGAVNNTFQVMLNEHIALVGIVHKQSGLLLEITLIGQGDGTMQSGAAIIQTMATLISVFSPELSIERRGKLVIDMIDKVRDQQATDSQTINAIEYTINRDEITGTFFYISPKTGVE